MLGLMVVAFLVLTSFSKKNAQKRQAEHERQLAEQLKPGVWVHTSVGFFGRFVDMDGKVVILETPSGEETYWDKRVIRSVDDLPFEADPEDEAYALEEYTVEEITSSPEATESSIEDAEEAPFEDEDR